MSLHPSLSVTLGNLRYDTHALDARVCLAPLPRGSSAEIKLPAGVRFEAAPGDEASLDLDGGEGPSTVLKGKVRAVRRTFDGVGVLVSDAAGDLAAYRPSNTFEKQAAAQIIRKLASDASVTAGQLDIDLDLPTYVAHPWLTAAEHIAGLARLAGAIALTDSDGRLNVMARPSGPADSALKYGREFVRYETRSQSVASPNRFAVGFGPAGSSSAPDALRHSVEFLPASAPDGGLGVRRYPTPQLRLPSAASDASTALQTFAAARAECLIAHCFLLAALRHGEVVEVQELPGGLPAGPWLVTRVEHRLAGGAGATWFEAEIAGAGSLLGDLLGALGGLGGLL